MAKRKETIKPPNAKELADAAKQMRKGHAGAARAVADAAVAARQGVRKGKGKAKGK